LFELTVRRRFAAAHRLEGHAGQCADLHGHTWTVEVLVAGGQLDRCGMLVDFKVLKEVVDGIVRQFDHKYLNQLQCLGTAQRANPTAENLAEFIYRGVGEALTRLAPGVAPKAVRVWESPDASATYRED